MKGIKNFIFKHETCFYREVVQDFYRESFNALYNVNIHNGSENKYIKYHENFLAPLIVKAAEGFQDRLRYFYDVRITEEYEQAAPDYALLYAAGLKNISPMSIKNENGMAALMFAIQSAALDIANNDEPVLFCCSELYNNYDKNFDSSYKACAFILINDCSDADFIIDDKINNNKYNISMFDFFAEAMNEKRQ